MAGSSSPESSISISSLLASCSLGSSKGSSSSTSSIEYKDRLYDSATKALEAYIEDYEESLRSSMASTGKINLHSSAPLSSKKKGTDDTNFRPKFSKRRYIPQDSDLLSLTTDDLLGFPSDGTLPFSSDWRQCKNYGPSLRKHTTLSSSLMSSVNTRANFHSLRRNRNSKSLDLQKLGDDLKENRAYVLLEAERESRAASYNNSPYLSRRSEAPRSYSRWPTSQKSELGVSGITSSQEVKYPLWIKDYGLLGKSNGHITKHLDTSSKGSLSHEPYRNLHDLSSLGSLHHRSYDQHGKEAVNSSSVGGKLDSGRSDLDVLKHLHTPLQNRPNDSPWRKSEAIEPLQKGFPEPSENNGSPRTEDVLEAERSWEKIPYTLKSPVPVPCKDEIDEELAAPFTAHLMEDFLKEKVKEESKAGLFSGGNHHGPVEALKHMLFNLQTFQHNFPPTQSAELVKEFHKVYAEAESEMQRVDPEVFPVNKSLQKALQHLARLKELVGDGNTKQNKENNEEA